jgi:hypothetical protein
MAQSGKRMLETLISRRPKRTLEPERDISTIYIFDIAGRLMIDV